MSSSTLSAAALALVLSAGAAYAQDTAVTGSISIAPEIREYVIKENVPSVKIEQQVMVGEALPESVEILTIPDHDDYAFAVVNDKRVIINRTDRKIVQIVE